MDPLDAARAARLIRPRIAIPMHWGTLLPIGLAGRHGGRLGDPPRIFAEHVASLASGVEVRILQPGQETNHFVIERGGSGGKGDYGYRINSFFFARDRRRVAAA